MPATCMLAACTASLTGSATSSERTPTTNSIVKQCSMDGEKDCLTTKRFAAVSVNALASKVLAGTVVGGVTGNSTVAKPPPCKSGDSDCLVTAPLVALDPTDLAPSDIRAGSAIASVTGTASARPGDCNADGAVDCVTTASYKAADWTKVISENIKAGATVSEITGTMPTRPSDCEADGATDCVVSGLYKSVDMTLAVAGNIKSPAQIAGVTGALVAAPADCSTDGALACVTTTTYPAANLAGFVATDFRVAKTVAGIGGALTDCTADGALGCVAVTGFPAAKIGPDNLDSANVLNGKTVGTVAGSLVASPAACAADGAISCVTQTSFPAVDITAKLLPSDIKKDFVIAGVTGDYPSASTPLADASAVTDLTSLAASVAAGTYEWFEANGSRHIGTISDAGAVSPGAASMAFESSVYRQFTVNGDADLTSGNIKSGASVFTLAGTYIPATCTSDGQQDCSVAGAFKAINVTGVSSWDIRRGKSVGGISGSLQFCRNAARLGRFNFLASPGSVNVTNADFWDSLDDHNDSVAGLPPTPLAYCSISTYSDEVTCIQNSGTWNSMAEYQCGAANWQAGGVDNGGTPGFCNEAGDSCFYIDLITGTHWSESIGTKTWAVAVSDCDAMTFAGFDDWRLPTMKEMLQAAIDGIRSVDSAVNFLNATDDYFHSSTTSHLTTANAWQVRFGIANTSNSQVKTTPLSTTCVRP